MATINGIKAGTTTITASYTDGGVTKTASVAFTVNSVAATLTFGANSTTLRYKGSAQKIGTITYTGDSSNVYYLVKTNNSTPAANDSGWTKISSWTTTNGATKTLDINQTNAATYYVFLKADAGTSYNAVSIKQGGSKEIEKRQVKITAPSVVSSTLTYSRSAQNLTSGGTSVDAYNTGTSVGTMYYYASTSSSTPTFSTSTWTTSAAKATDQGTYNIWYYCKVDDTANNTTASSGSAASINSVTKLSSTKVITPKTVGLTWGTKTWTYDGSSHSTTCTATGVVSGDTCTVTLSGNSVGPNVGTATVTASSLSNSNYQLPSSKTAELSITAKEVAIEWGTASWTYNGSAHSTTCTVKSTSLVGSDTCTVTLSGNSITYVGSTTVTATGLSNTNYKLPTSGLTKTISVTKANPTITVTGVNTTYTGSDIYAKLTGTNIKGTIYWKNGSAPTVSSYGGKQDVTSTGTNLSINLGSIKNNADDYTLYWLFVPSNASNSLATGHTYEENYNNGSGTVAMTINAAAITIPTITAVEVTYDKAAHSLTFPAVTGASITKYQTSTNGSTWTDASPATTNPSLTNAGTLYVRAYYTADGNHSGSGYTTGKTIKINQKAVTLSWGTASWTYDGNTHSTTCTAGSLESGDTCTVTLTGNSVGPNVGSATVTASSLSNANYKLPSSTTKSISITQREVTLTWGTRSWSFDGSAHSTTCTAGNLVTGDTCTVTLTGNSITNVGTTTVTASALSNDNYKLPSSKTATLTVTEGTLTVTATPYNATYDGASHNGITAISTKNQKGTAVSPTYTYCATESGTYSSTIPTVKNVTSGTKIYYKATLTGYTTASGYATAIVTAKTATLSWGTHTWTYDAASHTVTCSVSNLESGDTCTVTLSNATRTAQGTQTVTATALSNSNYALPSSKTTTLTINKRPVKITAASDSRAYNGSALTNSNYSGEAAGTNRGLVSGHSVTSCTVTGSQTVVGSSNNVPSAAVIKSGSTDVTSNYDIQYVNGTLTISARTVTITAPAFVSGTLTYNGSDQTVASGGSCTTGGTMYYYISTTNSTPTFSTSTWSTSANIQAKPAGTYYVWYYCKVDDTTNNTGTDINTVKKLANSKAINKKTVTLTWGTTTWTYNGSAHSTTCTLGGVVSGDSCTLTLSNNTITYVGDVTVSTSLNNNNYQLPSPSTKVISVTKATPAVTITGVNQTYTGSAYYSKVTKTDAKGTLYWRKGSAPTTSTYDGTTTIGSVGTPVGNPAALSTPINITSVTNDADDCQLYWLFVPSSTANSLASGQKYSDNFDQVSGGPVAMTIDKAANANVSVTLTTGTLVYNGAAQTLATATSTGTSEAKIGYKKGSAATADSQITWVNVGTNLQATEAGTYFIYRKWTADTNHSNSQTYDSVDTIEIELRPINVTASSASRAYNGSALTSNSATAETTGTNRGLASGHSMTSVSVSGSQTYVGSSNNVASSAVIKSGSTDVTANYNITYVNGTLTISKATPVVTVTGVTKDYTGGSFYATAKVNAKGTLYWKKGSAPTTSSNDGSVPITAINTNTNITSVKDNSDDFVLYWLFVPSNSETITTGQTYAANFTNAGGGSSDKVNLTINPRDIANITASATAVTYNGTSQTANISLSDTNGNLTSNDYTVSGNTKTDAGNYTITLTGKNNYTGTKTFNWVINKRAVTITAGSDTKTYDGTELTKNTVTASAQNNTNNTGMISSHHVHTWTVSGSQTLAGSSNNVVSAATIYDGATHGGSGDSTDVTSNYTITYANGTLTVNPAAITYTATNQTKVYDGSKLTAANTASRTAGLSALPSGHTATFTCTGEIGPAVSNGTKTLSAVVIKNGSGTDVTSSFTVTKKNGTLSITNATITYTTNNSVTKTCTDSATATTTTIGTREVVIASASASGVGSPTITYSIDQDGWSVSSDGKKIIVPEGVAAGTYNVNVSASAANHTTKTNGVSVVISSVSLTSLAMTLNATSINYGSSTTVKTVTATYSNGATKSVIDDATYTSNPTGIVTIS